MLNTQSNITQSESHPFLSPCKDLSDASFREEYKELCKKEKKTDIQSPKCKSWLHKESCFKCKIGPLLFKHFQIPKKCIDLCSCAAAKTHIANEYDKICRISLLNALSSYSYKTKAAKLADFKITINGTDHELDILKLKAGAIKRYTQPFTEHHIIGTAAFHDTSVFWKLDQSYYLEFRLKSKHCRTLLHIDSKRKSTDVASWWYQCWSVFGVREYTKKSKESGEYVNVEGDGVIHHQNMRLKPFLAAHHNDFVHSGDLKKSLNRIALIFWKKQTANHKTEIKINGFDVPLIIKRNNIKIKTEISSSEENELRNQLQCDTFSPRSNSNSNQMKSELTPTHPMHRSMFNGFTHAYNHVANMNVSVSNSNNAFHANEMENLRKETQIQTQTISELQRKIVTLEHQKLNLQNEMAQLRAESATRIKAEDGEQDIMSLKAQIKALQNELTLSQTNKMIENLPLFPATFTPGPSPWDLQEDKDDEISSLRDKIKILTNDNERLKALNKNDRISFHNKMQEYHSHIAREMQRMLTHKDEERIGLRQEITKLKEENTNWSAQCRIQGLIINDRNLNQDEDAPNPPSMKRQKLNDGSINPKVSIRTN